MRRPIRSLLVLSLISTPPLLAARSPLPPAPNGGAVVNLPQTFMDGNGAQWMIYHNGWLQMQGNNPVYSQAAMLSINNNQPGSRTNRARVDDKTGELVFDLVSNNGLAVTRRVLMNKKEGLVRYIDIFKNNQAQDVSVSIQLNTNLNYGIQQAQIVSDPKKKDKNLAWVAQTDGNACAVEVYASKGAKLTPNINWQPGNNNVQVVYQPTIPAGKEIALLHIHTLAPTADIGAKFVDELKPSKMMADISPDLRKSIVNFVSGGGMVGDFEVLRGDLFDVVELRGGDQYKGTLQDPTYKLETFYGNVELPADKVVGLINVGDFRPRQLLVTSEGEIFGGKLATDVLKLQLSSGQVTNIPLSQVSRMGYRKRPGEADEWTLAKPMVVLRSGDRVQVDPPTKPVEIATRYGRLSLDPKSIASLILASEDNGVHEILLSDGSRFAGLVAGDSFDMTLAGGKQAVKFPASAVSRVQLAPPPDAEPDGSASMDLTNGDHLVGHLTGQLQLDTSFDTITVNGPEVKKLTHPEGNALDIQLTLWDDSTVSGQLRAPDLQIALDSGVTLPIPVALVSDYNQPLPAPSAAMSDKIKSVVADLGADDFHRREAAESQLVGMGPAVLRVLKDLKSAQSPEAQQRIDSVIKQLEKKADKPTATGR